MSLNAVELRFPFTGNKGCSANHEKQLQSIIPPPPNFTVGTMHSDRQRFLQSPMATCFTPLQPTLGIVHGDLRLVCGCLAWKSIS